MAYLPAFCDNNNCGYIFESPFGSRKNVKFIEFKDLASRCPKCGSSASIPNGVYNFIDNSIELVKGPDITIERLIKLKNILEKLATQRPSYEEVKSNLDKEAPEIKNIIDVLPKTKNQLYYFLFLLITTIQLFIGQCEKGEDINITNKDVINQYNYNININLPQQNDVVKSINNNTTQVHKKLGRNEPCSCGSGKKYKHCHGKTNNTDK